MSIKELIKKYIDSQAEPKRDDMQELHKLLLRVSPKCKLWFFDGKNEEGKIVANPTVGYGSHIMKYADGKTKESFRIGISANTTGISVYIMGIKDKKYLVKTYAEEIGKASVTGYCIKFKSLKDIDIDVLEEAIRYGIKTQS